MWYSLEVATFTESITKLEAEQTARKLADVAQQEQTIVEAKLGFDNQMENAGLFSMLSAMGHPSTIRPLTRIPQLPVLPRRVSKLRA